jgi:imidazolonepropionase-like amidohydrolase
MADTLRRYGTSVPIVMGTDGGPGILGQFPGFSLHGALVFLRVCLDMTPLEALQTATLNPARALRLTDSLGTVAAGKVADLVLLDADPLADIWHTTQIRAVVANGRYYDRAALDGVLAALAAAAPHR